MNLSVAAALGYELQAAPLPVLGFHAATRVGSLVYTSGNVSSRGDEHIKGKVGEDIDLLRAQEAAVLAAANCLSAALAVADNSEIERVVKIFGMVNVAPGFNDTTSVINAATDFLNAVFEGQPSHARSAVGMVLPADWAVEIEMILALRD